MAKIEDIREGLQRIGRKFGPDNSLLAKVKSIQVEEQTCVLLDDAGLEIFDVRLAAVLTGNASVVVEPEINSWVMATRIEEGDDWCISWVENAAKLRLTTATTTVELTDKLKVTANGQSLSQLFDDLFAAINQMAFSHPQGPTTGLVNAAQFTELNQRFKQVFK